VKLRRPGKFLVAAALCGGLLIQDASAQSCRTHESDTARAIGPHITSLQRLEMETSDRTKGLDTRPFDVLLAEARKAAAVIADPQSLALEERIDRCRNRVRPIRKYCADAANNLLEILEKYVASPEASPKPEYDRPRYAGLMADCEKAMRIKPVNSVLRGTDEPR
jgi:hypothetical protein